MASTVVSEGNHTGETYLLSGKDGKKIWEFSKGSAIFIVPDINGDGVSEIVTPNNGGTDNISLLSGTDGHELWNKNIIGSNNSEIWGSKYTDLIKNCVYS